MSTAASHLLTPPVSILGLPVDNLSMDESLAQIIYALGSPLPTRVNLLNADCVNLAVGDVTYRASLMNSDLLLPDGIGMRIAARWLGSEFRENVNGTDLFPKLCARLAGRMARVFLLGARPGVADRVADWIRRTHPGVIIAGTQHGYFDASENETVVERIRRTRPDVILVAFGAPRQEVWLDQHLGHTGAAIGLGVGGLFDFYSGRIPRAPLWIREVGCEWVYRLLMEPRRLWRRYLIGNGLFLARIWRERNCKSQRSLRAVERSSS